MKKLRWPLLIVLLALAAIALLLFSQQKTLTAIEPEVIKPVTGGIYTEGLVGSISRLNPLLDFYHPNDHDVDRLLFSGLMHFDDRGVPQGDLAESWGISQDGKVYNFSLRSKAAWHDGEPVTSEDILFTIELLRSAESIAPQDIKDLWNEVEVEPLDEKTIQFRLPEPFAPFIDYLTFGVLPQHLLEDISFEALVNAEFNMKPVGSGPYRFERLIVEGGQIAGLILEANEAYYLQRPFIDRFVFRYYPDAISALEAYRAGEIMGLGHVPEEILPAALREPNLRLYTGRLPEMTLVFLNLDNPQVPFFAEPEVRRALLTGMNRQWMIDNLLGGQAILADGPIFPNTWAYYDGIERINFDPEAAVNILKGAGYTIPSSGGSVRQKEDGTALEFELVYPDDERHTLLAESIQRDWQRLGVSVTLTPVPYDALVSENLDTRLYQAALVDINLVRSPDPDPYPFWHQAQATGGQNYAKWDDRQASEYLEQARVLADIGERTKLYRNFQVRFNQELPALPLFYPVYTFGVDTQVQGVSMGPLFDPCDRFATATQWYLQAGPGVEPAGTEVGGTAEATQGSAEGNQGNK
jgi:peptide/nickel transport system substrate-binding protein